MTADALSMAGWATLARRVLARVLAVALRRGLRQLLDARADGSRHPTSGGARRGSVTVIDVQPAGFFDRYSEAASHVVVRAADAAAEFGHVELDPRHLLLALAEEPGTVAAALAAEGLTADALRTHVSDAPVAADRSRPMLSSGARQVLADARHRADARSAFDVEPRDVLAALASVDDRRLASLLEEVAAQGSDALRRAAGAL